MLEPGIEIIFKDKVEEWFYQDFDTFRKFVRTLQQQRKEKKRRERYLIKFRNI